MAIVPAVVSKLVKKGFKVNVEENAGALASFNNKAYEEAGAKITNTKDTFQTGIHNYNIFKQLESSCQL